MSLFGPAGAGFIALCVMFASGFAAESELSPAATISQSEQTNSQQILQAILQLDERLRSNQLAFEQSNLEAKLAGIRSAEALSNGLQTIEKALSTQQEAFSIRSAQEMETLRNSNRAMLMVGASFATVACLAMLIVAYFQWRMSRVWLGISTTLPALSRPGRDLAFSAVGAGDAHFVESGKAESANARLLGAVEQLEKRVHELEESSATALEPHARVLASGDNGDLAGAGNGDDANGSGPSTTKQDPRIPVLLRQGQLMLKENNLEAALAAFDEVLALNPRQTEALVKKGAALERLHKANEAFECYDRAITADRSMTLAYLYKGGLCSRLERFQEALECYEKALRTHDEAHG